MDIASKTTFRTISTAGAVDELLLTEGQKVTTSNLVGSLEYARSGEGPARATDVRVPLVFDSGHCTTVSPIERLGDPVGTVGHH